MSNDALSMLKNIPQWVCYKNEIPKGGDKPAKMPKNPHTGYNASSTNKQTWSDFMTAVRAKKSYRMDGLGWVFTENAGIIGIDLDDCIVDGEIQAWAQEIINEVHSYTEISPSGKGLHIFCCGTIPKALGPTPDSLIEMYAKGRYFTVTGDHLNGTPETISSRQTSIEDLWKTESQRRRKSKEISSRPKHMVVDRIQSTGNLSAYAEKAYLDEIAKLSATYEGCRCRNDTLNRVAFNLGQFIEADLLNRGEIEAVLLSISLQVGLDETSATKTIQSGINGGIRNPRTNWPAESPPSSEVTPKSEPIGEFQPGIDLIYHENVTGYLEFIHNRWGLTKNTINDFKVGFCDACPTSTYSASFTAPYYQAGDLVDIRHRLLSPNGQGTYRPEVENYPAHLFDAGLVDKDDRVILVNREFNAMLLAQHYFPVLGLPSTFKREWLEDFEGIKQVYIALNPGQDEAARSIGCLLARSGIDARVCSLPFSPCDMLVKYGCSLEDFSKFIEQGWGVTA